MQDWAQTKTLVDIKMLASELAEKKQSRADFPFTDVWTSYEILLKRVI